MLNKEIEDRYQQWLSSPCFDENTKAELAALTDEKEIDFTAIWSLEPAACEVCWEQEQTG